MDGMDMDGTRPSKGQQNVVPDGRQVLAVRMGRGRTGGSTLLDWIIQCGRQAGRSIVIGDGDRRNPTLAGLYPPAGPGGATQPPTDETADVKEWITAELANAVMLKASLVLDLGGGDRVLSEYGLDLGLIEFCARRSITPLALYVTGPDSEDFEHVLSIWRAGYFRAAKSLLVLNEHLVPQGKTPTGAFDHILHRPEMEEMLTGGMYPVLMPRLPCLGEMRRLNLSFLEAIEGKLGSTGKPLDPVRQFMVEAWHGKMTKAFKEAGAWEWLP